MNRHKNIEVITISREMQVLSGQADCLDNHFIDNKLCKNGHGFSGTNLYFKEDGKCVICKKRRDADYNQKQGARDRTALNHYDALQERLAEENWWDE